MPVAPLRPQCCGLSAKSVALPPLRFEAYYRAGFRRITRSGVHDYLCGKYLVGLKLLQFCGIAHLTAVDIDLRRAAADDAVSAVLAVDKGQAGNHFVSRTHLRKRRTGHVSHQSRAAPLNHRAAVCNGYALEQPQIVVQHDVVNRPAVRKNRLEANERHLQQALLARHGGKGERAVGLGHAA